MKTCIIIAYMRMVLNPIIMSYSRDKAVPLQHQYEEIPPLSSLPNLSDETPRS